jgi:hypothetical protein
VEVRSGPGVIELGGGDLGVQLQNCEYDSGRGFGVPMFENKKTPAAKTASATI